MVERRHVNGDISYLSSFTPTLTYTSYFINQKTSLSTLSILIDLAQQNKLFTLGFQTDFSWNNAPALIEILFIQPRSIVLLMEMFHLPDPSTDLFHQIRQLFSIIFHSSKILQGWGNVINDLRPFINYGLFTNDHLVQIRFVDVQKIFKFWYNDSYGHDDECSLSFVEKDHPSCTCPHRPYKNPNAKWSLEIAIAMTFNQFLDKRLSLGPWRLGLDLALSTYLSVIPMGGDDTVWNFIENQTSRCHRLTLYAISHSIAVTELSMAASDDNSSYIQFLERFISKPFNKSVEF